MRFDVEIETDPVDNFTVPIPAAVDRVASALGSSGEIGRAETAGRPDIRTLTVHGSIDAPTALAALTRFCQLVEHALAQSDLGALRVRCLHVKPQPKQARTHPNPVSADEHRFSNSSQEWPSMFRNRHAPPVPQRGADAARLYAHAHQLARHLREHNQSDYARAIENTLRPGESVAQACLHLRHELVQLQMTEIPVLLGIEPQLSGLVATASRISGAGSFAGGQV
ncbi:MAG: hypothetical protein ACR2GX_09165 [Candidatus Dormibacteria bacterium]